MLNDKIKKLREQKNLTQKQLAEEIGVKQSTIGMIESGKNKGSKDTILKLAKYFNVSVEYLLSTEEKLDIAMDAINRINELAKEGLNGINLDIENSIYSINARFDGETFSLEEQKEIIDFIEFVISKRNK